MTILAASTALLGFILKLMTAGYWLLISIWFYIAIGVAHVAIHRKASQCIPQNYALAIVSNILLLMAFLVQIDEADGPCKWTTITDLLSRPGFSPCFKQISRAAPPSTTPTIPLAGLWALAPHQPCRVLIDRSGPVSHWRIRTTPATRMLALPTLSALLKFLKAKGA
jgi:hypothetical protein